MTNERKEDGDKGRSGSHEYINTVAAVAIAPSGAGEELSKYVAQAVGVIRDSGLKNETNAMFTNIEGDLDDVLRVVRDAALRLASQGHRTGVSLKLDIRPGFRNQMERKPQLVDELLSGQAQSER
ncbi:hypothetical protein BACT_0441 [Bifidobacterium actinocoloniiforme DSM 22766]|uniref:Thiamine-binding protein domain-containing protein n=1 Tax=Bifidobacterium actinocoloniiforme DSM 22766 TaxID=1437605 RepID=A0A086YZP1_9BIFI|nr:MTH1187 family thiamine-binding protein [Bifidobacterium actinocoloniiforme]AKV55047.1 hypothetical protein AB656_00830 [Bifidobacterium actinocoloniiforme DSM 22766]KFI39741.1 hypothetical protein BACT_0441 [Bifidobacterium actinocoloniiforme DSM 22766]